MATELPSVLRARSGRSWVGALVLFLLSAMGWPSVALGNGADDVVREMVSGRVDAIRQRLQQEHDSEDYGLLLRTKEMVDAVLLPAFLLGELGSDRQWEVCRILGHDFRYEDVRAHLSGSAALEQALSPYGLGAGREVRFSGVVECFACEGAGYPVALAMDGAVGRERGWIHVAWHEPYMANSYLFWPLYPAGSILEWDAEGAHYTSLAEEGGQPVAVSFGEGPPLFNNPGCVYNPLGERGRPHVDVHRRGWQRRTTGAFWPGRRRRPAHLGHTESNAASPSLAECLQDRGGRRRRSRA
jgi:hypothetical protein